MLTEIYQTTGDEFILKKADAGARPQGANLVLCFSSKELTNSNLLERIRNFFPKATVLLTSTAGEILHTKISESSAVIVALEFERTKVASDVVNVQQFNDSYEAGIDLITPFVKTETPVHVLIFSDGQLVNGSELVKGLNEVSKGEFLITGGLAGDGNNFGSTLVGLNETPVEGNIAAIAFYGDKLFVRSGCKGGWEPFGMMRMITSSNGNILKEIENCKVPDLYKEFLGSDAEGLPGSAYDTLFVFIFPGNRLPVVRTILSIDEAEGTMTFAGDMPEGCFIRFMKTSLDKITDAASKAAVDTNPFPEKHDFALLISCVGRKLVLGSMAQDELKAIDAIFNYSVPMAGFYSYGEIAPLVDGEICQLHNQTITITTFSEVE